MFPYCKLFALVFFFFRVPLSITNDHQSIINDHQTIISNSTHLVISSGNNTY